MSMQRTEDVHHFLEDCDISLEQDAETALAKGRAR